MLDTGGEDIYLEVIFLSVASVTKLTSEFPPALNIRRLMCLQMLQKVPVLGIALRAELALVRPRLQVVLHVLLPRLWVGKVLVAALPGTIVFPLTRPLGQWDQISYILNTVEF